MGIKVTISPATDDAVVTGEFTKETMTDGVLGPPEVSGATASDPVKEVVFLLGDGDVLRIEAKPSVKIAYDSDQKANLPVPPETPPVVLTAKVDTSQGSRSSSASSSAKK